MKHKNKIYITLFIIVITYNRKLKLELIFKKLNFIFLINFIFYYFHNFK